MILLIIYLAGVIFVFFINPGTEIKIDDINKINDTEARMLSAR